MPWSRIGPYPGAFYKDHWACFECRKMVRKPFIFESGVKHADERRLRTVMCPECKGPLRNMGKAFRPPLRSALHRRRKVERQYLFGVRWGNGTWLLVNFLCRHRRVHSIGDGQSMIRTTDPGRFCTFRTPFRRTP
jgi:hypothetical protein